MPWEQPLFELTLKLSTATKFWRTKDNSNAAKLGKSIGLWVGVTKESIDSRAHGLAKFQLLNGPSLLSYAILLEVWRCERDWTMSRRLNLGACLPFHWVPLLQWVLSHCWFRHTPLWPLWSFVRQWKDTLENFLRHLKLKTPFSDSPTGSWLMVCAASKTLLHRGHDL